MKYAYIIAVVLLVLIGGYFAYGALQNNATNQATQEEVPEGYHRMSDGTLMRNDAGTEGMGALSELQNASMETQEEPALETNPNAKVFEVRGVNYGYDVEEIRVKKGETVTINFESTDGFHDWVVDEFDARTEKVQPGTPTSVTFVASESGTFEYYCSVGQHRAHGMVGKLVVE